MNSNNEYEIHFDTFFHFTPAILIRLPELVFMYRPPPGCKRTCSGLLVVSIGADCCICSFFCYGSSSLLSFRRGLNWSNCWLYFRSLSASSSKFLIFKSCLLFLFSSFFFFSLFIQQIKLPKNSLESTFHYNIYPMILIV
jgi:hypothetical protein